jgi:hypothetical protein
MPLAEAESDRLQEWTPPDGHLKTFELSWTVRRQRAGGNCEGISTSAARAELDYTHGQTNRPALSDV